MVLRMNLGLQFRYGSMTGMSGLGARTGAGGSTLLRESRSMAGAMRGAIGMDASEEFDGNLLGVDGSDVASE